MATFVSIPEEMIEMQPPDIKQEVPPSNISRIKEDFAKLQRRIEQSLPHIHVSHQTETRIWMLCMLVIGTFDMLINWLNFYELSSQHMRKGIGIGPPTQLQWILLLVFSVVGTVLYIPESLNTLSSLWNNGRTRYPIVWELLVILMLEQIPLSAVNYFIVSCRRKYINSTQTFCGVTSIVYVFIRLLWFAHIEGNLKEKKTPHRKFYFMLCGALFSSAFAFPVMSWRMNLEKIRWDDISILLIKTPHLKDSHIGEYNLTEHLQNQGLPLREPWLVPSLKSIGLNSTHLHMETYRCITEAELVPPMCENGGYLVFKFAYIDKEYVPPYGQITYNMAVVRNSTCSESKEALNDGWGLFYVKIEITSVGQRHTVMALDPWPDQCTTSPYPSFDPSIHVCPGLQQT